MSGHEITMPLDPDRLLAFDIPQVRQVVTPATAALYALSVGYGQDPLDDRQRAFVDPDLGPRPAPTLALVLAHPGFWLAHPDSGVDPRGVLHADQSLEIIRPLPIDAVVVSRSRITGLVDKGPGKAALLRTETLIEDEAGTPLARLLRTTFLRGAGGFGGENEPTVAPAPGPEGPPDRIVDLATRPEQALLYRLNGDLNPLHSDPGVARTAGFERPILHGLAAAGVVGHALLAALADYDETRIRALRMRFCGVVTPGETLRTEVWANGVFRARVIERNAIVIDEGRALVDPPMA